MVHIIYLQELNGFFDGILVSRIGNSPKRTSSRIFREKFGARGLSPEGVVRNAVCHRWLDLPCRDADTRELADKFGCHTHLRHFTEHGNHRVVGALPCPHRAVDSENTMLAKAMINVNPSTYPSTAVLETGTFGSGRQTTGMCEKYVNTLSCLCLCRVIYVKIRGLEKDQQDN